MLENGIKWPKFGFSGLAKRCQPLQGSAHQKPSTLQPPQQQKLHQRFLYMHAVFGFIPDHGLRAVDDFGCDFFFPVGG